MTTAALTPEPSNASAGRPAAPPRVVAVALGLGGAAVVLLPGGPPGVGVALLALATAAALAGLAPRLGSWQVVHGSAAVLLAGSAAVRDARWLVALDLLAAVGLGTLALVPAGSWSALPAAPFQLLGRVLPAPAWLVRGLAPVVGLGRDVGPAARGAALTGVLLVVFVPLLTSADEGFADLLAAVLPDVDALGALPGRLVVAVLVAVVVTGAGSVLLNPPVDPAVGPAVRQLRRTSEWLLPLAALDVLLAAFLFSQRGPAVGSYADQVHAGFWQLLAVTALVLLVVAGTVRYVPRSTGVLAALGVLCLLTLVVDGSALSRLNAYTDAYGLTRLRVGVAAVCLSLGALLLLVLAAGALRIRAAAVAHGVVLVAAVTLLLLTAWNPDARIVQSAAARGAQADTGYLSTLSADAVPAVRQLPQATCTQLLPLLRPVPERPWTSANLSRVRARPLQEQAC